MFLALAGNNTGFYLPPRGKHFNLPATMNEHKASFHEKMVILIMAVFLVAIFIKVLFY